MAALGSLDDEITLPLLPSGAGFKPSNIDGFAPAGETPVTITHYLGITPEWVDRTGVPQCRAATSRACLFEQR